MSTYGTSGDHLGNRFDEVIVFITDRVRGSIRLVFRSTDARILRKVVVGKNQISNKSGKKIKNG